jgi:hypothetical protein
VYKNSEDRQIRLGRPLFRLTLEFQAPFVSACDQGKGGCAESFSRGCYGSALIGAPGVTV